MQILIRDKTKKLPILKGYSTRRNFLGAYGIVIHSTHGGKGSSFENEINFLLSSTSVSAHYIISREGVIVNLVPVQYCAWHAGRVFSNMKNYSNDNSIGIELHYTPGEDKNLPKQKAALTDLCKYLMDTYPVVGIKTHREIAKPHGRKIDPSNYTDEEFEVWRASLQQRRYYKVKTGAKLYTAPNVSSKVAAHINTEHIQSGIVTFSHTFEGKEVQDGFIWVTNGIGFFSGGDVT